MAVFCYVTIDKLIHLSIVYVCPENLVLGLHFAHGDELLVWVEGHGIGVLSYLSSLEGGSERMFSVVTNLRFHLSPWLNTCHRWLGIHTDRSEFALSDEASFVGDEVVGLIPWALIDCVHIGLLLLGEK